MASTIKVDNVQNQPGTNIVSKCGTDVTLGASGDTVALACGASQTGFGRTGTVDWITTPKVTGDSPVTGVTGKGYFMNTTAGAITINLPAGAAGSIVSVSDYARTFNTYNLTISPNGAEKIGGVAENATLSVDGQAATFVYVDSTKGWINIQNAEDTEIGVSPYITATVSGACNTLTPSGNDQIATFLNPGTFEVTKIATACAPVNNLVSYMVVAGGGGAGGTGPSHVGGGGGAGGVRETKSPATPYTASPLDGYPTPGNRITVTATSYPITVGGGGTQGTEPLSGGNGVNSTFSTITSAGGGGGGSIGSPPAPTEREGQPGGSGGGGSSQTAASGGSGNTPSTTPAQGKDGAIGTDAPPDLRGGGGGGATVCGTAGQNSPFIQGAGGAGATSCISGSPVARGGGGGAGGTWVTPTPGLAGVGGTGGGGNGGTAPGPDRSGNAGSDNTGGGGGGAAGGNPACGQGGASGGGLGGSGVVIIRYKFQ